MGKKLILIADDDESTLSAVKETLGEKFEIITANTCGKALSLIDEKKPDMVIMDVMMPDMDGRDAVKKLHQTHTPDNPPVIFLSAKTQIEDIEQGLLAGGFEYITKPFSPSKLIKKIEEVFERIEIRKKIQQRKKL